MRCYILAFLTGPQLVAATITSCNANDCLRQVRATNFPTRQGIADCSSFFMKTVTPATVTTTQTVTGTTQTNAITSVETDLITATSITTVINNNFTPRPRQVTQSPISIPAYASSCKGTSAYSSACSCIGVTETTTTVQAPTFTSTVSISATSSTTTLTTTSTTTTTTSTTTFTCPANAPTQVVANPGFESHFNSWTASSTGNEVIISLSFCGVASDPGADCQVTGANCNCAFVGSDSPGGTGTLSQTLTGVCPGSDYSFVAYLGLSNNVITGSAGDTTVGATLDGVTIFAPLFPCSTPNSCNIPGGSGPFMQIGPITVTPQSTSPVLQFSFVSVHPTTIFELPVFIDDVTLTLL